MIVTLILFGLFCIVGTFLILLFFGMGTGNYIGIKVHRWKNGESLTPLEFVRSTEKQLEDNYKPEIAEAKRNYFIKLGNNSKVPIEANEVADAKKRGYEVLIE